MILLENVTYEKIKKLKICLVTGTGTLSRPSKIDLLAELDTIETAKKLLNLMKNEGFKNVTCFTATEDNLGDLNNFEPDIFVNLAEGQKSEFCNHVYRALSTTGVPVTGSNVEANEKATNKHATKLILGENNIPTPPGIIADNISSLSNLPKTLNFPLIIKPVFEDGSTGIYQKSVVENILELQKIAKEYIEKYKQPVIVENFIKSREFSPTVFERNGKIEILPIAELVYKPLKNRKWDIYCYKTKWLYDSEEYKSTPSVAPPENLSSDDEEIIKKYCVLAFKAFHISDYVRFDIRFDEKTSVPYFLDVNTNPSLEIDPKYSLAISVKAAGLDMAKFLALIIKSSMERYGKEM